MQRIIKKNTLSFTCSKSMQYLRTPTDIWLKLIKEHTFTIDLFASDDNHLLPRYYTKKNDAMAKDWSGEYAYVHPLFDSKILNVVQKAFNTPKFTGIFLLPASTHTKYFHDYIYKNPNCTIEFLRKPPKGFRFLKDDGTPDDLSRIAYIKPLMIVKMVNK
jgi:hypothetical protein